MSVWGVHGPGFWANGDRWTLRRTDGTDARWILSDPHGQERASNDWLDRTAWREAGAWANGVIASLEGEAHRTHAAGARMPNKR